MTLGAAATLVAAVAVAACGATMHGDTRPRHPSAPLAGLSPDLRPVRTGRGPRYSLASLSPAVARRRPVAGLQCTHAHPRAYGAHLELFARGLVLQVPAGIGVAPPRRRRGVYVLRGACSYGVRTLEPTGVLLVDGGRAPPLAALFALWGQPLSATRLASFDGTVTAFVGGVRWRGAPGAIPLARHAQIVLELAGVVAPHRTYRFPPGL